MGTKNSTEGKRVAELSPNQIRDRLVEIINSRGLSIMEACAQANVDKNVVFNMKTFYPNVSTLMNFADCLGCTLNDICDVGAPLPKGVSTNEWELLEIYRKLSTKDQNRAKAILEALL